MLSCWISNMSRIYIGVYWRPSSAWLHVTTLPTPLLENIVFILSVWRNWLASAHLNCKWRHSETDGATAARGAAAWMPSGAATSPREYFYQSIAVIFYQEITIVDLATPETPPIAWSTVYAIFMFLGETKKIYFVETTKRRSLAGILFFSIHSW